MIRKKWKQLGLLALVSGIGATSFTVSKPAIAAPDCEGEAVIRCNANFYKGKFPEYATFEDCVEGEVEKGNCYHNIPEPYPPINP